MRLAPARRMGSLRIDAARSGLRFVQAFLDADETVRQAAIHAASVARDPTLCRN